jgi:two-component system sensor histidine kinase SenX3
VSSTAVGVAGGAIALAAGLAVALAAVLVRQRRAARRLWTALVRLDAPVPAGHGLEHVAAAAEGLAHRTAAEGDQEELARRRLLRVLWVLPQGIVVYDEAGAIVFRNHVAAGYLASARGESIVEEAIAELAAAAELRRGDGAGGPVDPPTRTIELAGPPRRTLVLSGVLLDAGSGERLGVGVVVDDVTDRRRLESVRRDFVANIGHELKTPVGALGLLAETLVAEDDPAVAQRLAERILTEAFRVGRTIDDLLALSQLEADAARLRHEVSVGAVVREAVDRVQPAAEQRSIAIDVQDVSHRLVVLGDRRQLVSATFNLLENAVKYSEGGSTVRVQTATDGRWIDVSVVDRGIGIPERDLERVFERFYRVDRARSRETGGTGLGLAIVRHVASNHDGDVRVESVEGEGSTFTLRLPLGSGPVAVSAEAG